MMQDSKSCELYANLFIPNPKKRKNPDVSPLYADLDDMPPALFTVGNSDPFLDDSLLMANRWLAAGNKTNLIIYLGAPHAFDLIPSPEKNHHSRVNKAFIMNCLKN